jgi:hypothetical protein
MTILLAGRQLQPGDMPEHDRLAIALINGGAQWLDWASRDAARQYHFDDVTEMVEAVQTGLHGTPILLLREIGLLLSPVKCMTMDASDLRLLANPGQASASALAALMKRHCLTSHADLAQISGFLRALGVADAPAFRSRSLADLLMLRDLQHELDVVAPLTAEAVRFALANAGSIPEFVDYLRFYRDCVKAFELGDATPFDRMRSIDTVLNTLLPKTFLALDSLEVGGFLAPWELHAAIREWLSTGRQLGFARASLAVQQFVADGYYTGQLGHEAVKLLHEFLERAQLALGAAEVGAGHMAQDGLTCTFTFGANGDSAQVEISAAGRVGIARFGRLARSMPRPNPAGPGSTPKQRARRGVSARVS